MIAVQIELTKHQQQVLDRALEPAIPTTPEATLDALPEGLVQVIDPRTNATYILLGAHVYEKIRAILEEERLQKSIATLALRNVTKRMHEEL